MGTMKSVQHEMSKEKWRKLISERNQSGKPIVVWCKEQNVALGQYYYWLKILREESLIQAGTLAITNSVQFAQVKPRVQEKSVQQLKICARIQMDSGIGLEVYNGADETTLESLIQIIRR